jgi:hypothetical protein
LVDGNNSADYEARTYQTLVFATVAP